MKPNKLDSDHEEKYAHDCEFEENEHGLLEEMLEDLWQSGLTDWTANWAYFKNSLQVEKPKKVMKNRITILPTTLFMMIFGKSANISEWNKS